MTDEEIDATSARRIVRQALVRYAIGALAVLIVVSALAVWLSSILATQEALREAERTARAITEQIVAPLAGAPLERGDPTALGKLDAVVKTRMSDGSIYRVKVWRRLDGAQARILYSDDKRVMGRVFSLEPEESELFGTTGTQTNLSDLGKDENEFERPAGRLIEVYSAFSDESGAPLLFEAYFPANNLGTDARAIARQVLPLTLGALLLLALATLPLAVLMARRVARLEADRRHALYRAAAAPEEERRRISVDLHDGVVQDLAGVGMALDTLHRRLSSGNGSTMSHVDLSTVERARDIVQGDVGSLRSLITEAYAADIDGEHLVAGIEALAARLPHDGTVVSLDAPADLDVDKLHAVIAFRVVRESLRNATKHAGAQHIWIGLARSPRELRVTVADDGRGFDASAGVPEGHFGLRMIREAVETEGGTLVITSAAGSGTTVSAVLPV